MVDQIPIGIKVIASLHYLNAAILLILGTFLTMVLVVFSGEIKLLALEGLVIVPTLLYFFVGYGLWHGKKWSRMTAIILSLSEILTITYTLINKGFVQDILYASGTTLIENLVIAGYLIFSKNARTVFS